MNTFLITSIVFLGAAVVAVPLFKRLGLASVLGYLAAGSLLGPFGLHVETNPHNLMEASEIGIVMLLFVIGLELKPSRLWTMRHQVFGAGSLQFFSTAIFIFLVSMLSSLSFKMSLIIGVALSLSSTAFALQMLSERKQMTTQFGRLSFSILLFQDLVAIPFLAILPFLSEDFNGFNLASFKNHMGWLLTAIVLIGALPFLLRPILRMVATTRIRELFTALTLLLVLGLALVMEKAGLSMALGSFIGGILLSDSEYRHQLEADIEPFKGLLLGLFFIAIGMGVNYGLLFEEPFFIFSTVICYMGIKAAAAFLVARYFGLNRPASLGLAMVIPQGGEFAFVIFSVCLNSKLFSQPMNDTLNLIIALSMALTPLFALLHDQYTQRARKKEVAEFDRIPKENNKVIIAGFGRFGQIIGRVMRMLELDFTALEIDSAQVEVLRKFGSKVYYGDASRVDLLTAAGADKARFMIICIDDVESSIQTVDVVQTHFPNLKIFARARNRNHAFLLLDRGIELIYRETLASSAEMAEELLIAMGYPHAVAKANTKRFRAHDAETLLKQHAVYKDEKLLIRTSKEAAEQLIDVLRSDKHEPSLSSI